MAEREYCQFDSLNAVNVTGFKRIPEGNEQRLQEALATVGPVSVSIDASNFSFMHYQSGIYFDDLCSAHHLDHAVLAVGYGVDDDGVEYYILTNWWGSDWGENGYFRLKRNECNHCGIFSEAMYPILQIPFETIQTMNEIDANKCLRKSDFRFTSNFYQKYCIKILCAPERKTFDQRMK